LQKLAIQATIYVNINLGAEFGIKYCVVIMGLMKNNMPEKQIIIDDLRIHYYQSDDFDGKNTTVFLHGWNSESTHLKSIFQEVDNCIALDLPGFGKSDRPNAVWGVAEYADLLRKFLEKLAIENPILVGHSFGGSTAMKYLSQDGAAKKLILLSAAGIRKTGVKIHIYKIIAKIVGFFLKIPVLTHFRDRIRKKAYKMMGSEDYIEAGVLKESYKKIIRQDLSEEMKKIKIETVLIWGENDTATPLDHGKRMQELISNSELFIIKSAGHFAFIDQPEEFKKIFLREINVT